MVDQTTKDAAHAQARIVISAERISSIELGFPPIITPFSQGERTSVDTQEYLNVYDQDSAPDRLRGLFLDRLSECRALGKTLKITSPFMNFVSDGCTKECVPIRIWDTDLEQGIGTNNRICPGSIWLPDWCRYTFNTISDISRNRGIRHNENIMSYANKPNESVYVVDRVIRVTYVEKSNGLYRMNNPHNSRIHDVSYIFAHEERKDVGLTTSNLCYNISKNIWYIVE